MVQGVFDILLFFLSSTLIYCSSEKKINCEGFATPFKEFICSTHNALITGSN